MKIKKDAAVKQIVEKTFPEYTGRKFRLNNTGRVTFYDTNWGGGTRNSYKAIRLDEQMKSESLPDFAPWANPVEGKTIEIPEGFAIVEHSIFCGQDAGITIHVASRLAVEAR